MAEARGHRIVETDAGLIADTSAQVKGVVAGGYLLTAETGVAWIDATDPAYGATGDGVTDDTTALQAALVAARAAAAPFYLPAGTYRVTATLTGAQTTPLRVFGDGPGITVLRHEIPAAAMFSVSGTQTSIEAITVASALGATQITIASTAGMAADDLLLLRDTTQTVLGDSTRVVNAVAGEYVRIMSVDSATSLTLRGRLEFAYTTSGDVRKITPVSGVSLSNLSMVNPAPGTRSSTARGLVALRATKIRVDGVEFRDMDAAAIYIQNSWGFVVRDCEFQNARDAETGNAPYDIAVAGSSSHGLVSGCEGRYGRHMVTTLPTETEPAASHVRISDCIATEYNQTAFDTHPGSRKITFTDCEAHHCRSSGFKLRGPDQSVINPTVTQATQGVYVVYGADRARIVGGRLSGCDIGVKIQSSDDCFVGGDLLIDNPVEAGIQVDDDAAWGAFMTDLAIDGVEVTGNPSVAALDFTNQWHDNFRIERWRAPDATTRITNHTEASIGDASTRGLPGVITPQFNGGQQLAVVTANRAYLNRVYLTEQDLTISAIAFSVGSAATADDAVDVGIYDAAGVRLISSGATLGKLNGATGWVSVPLAYTLKARTVYYIAMSVGTIGGTAASLALTLHTGSNTNFSQPFGALYPNVVAGIKATSHPLPASIASPSFGATPFLLGLK